MSAESPTHYERESQAEHIQLGERVDVVPLVHSSPDILIHFASKKPHIYERRKKFPSYTSKKPSLEMLLYELLGIRIYRPIWELYMTPFWWSGGDDIRDIFTTSTDPEKHKRFKRFMISHAIIHAAGFIAFFLIFKISIAMLLINTLVNIYPIMLQRYNWLRMKRAGLL